MEPVPIFQLISNKDKMWDVNAGWRIVIAHSYSAGGKCKNSRPVFRSTGRPVGEKQKRKCEMQDKKIGYKVQGVKIHIDYCLLNPRLSLMA
jgi:hypothetical protein